MSGLLFTLFTHAIVLLSGTTDQPQQQVSLKRNSTASLQSPYTVLVEGNVGSGKSTLVNILAGVEPRTDAIPEPVEAWQNVSGTGVNMLDLMFKNGSRWSGTFQLVSTLSRLKVATDIDRSKPARIMERSIFSERYCFLENQRRMGLLSAAEFALMDRWFQFAQKHFWDYVKPDLIVYLRTDVETLKKHIKKRGRSEETDIDPEFLEGVQRYHEDWLYHRNSSFPVPAPVLVLDAGLPVQDFTQEVLRFKDTIIPPHVLE